VRTVVEAGARFTATVCFAAQHRLQALIQATRRDWAAMDLLITPTAGTCYTRAAIDEEPIPRNADLGYYTNFVNLMDLSALAVPPASPARACRSGCRWSRPPSARVSCARWAMRYTPRKG
jgi:Asp-tRNA(Asn)/Glu-tRNA(Gln) amidotransferase A subunit family amidase